MELKSGQFVRVREDHPEKRCAGKDGLISEVDANTVGLTFGYDRHSNWQNVICHGIELWMQYELDLNSVY